MIRLAITHASPGMRLSLPVPDPRRPGCDLIPAGAALTRPALDRLTEHRIDIVWIECPGTEAVDAVADAAVIHAQAALVRRAALIFASAARNDRPSKPDLDGREEIAALLEALRERPEAAQYLGDIGSDRGPHARCAASVCVLSLLMGLRLGEYIRTERTRCPAGPSHDLASLGAGALLADVGMPRLDEDVIRRWDGTHDQNDRAWREHVSIGHAMVRGAVEPSAGAAVLGHHQRFDGSGFPDRRLPGGRFEPAKGTDIHIYARIVGAAALFDQLRHPPGVEAAGLAPVPVVRVLSRLHRPPFCGWLDPVVLRALVDCTPAFTPGSIVRLSDGRRAVVTGARADDPCRPSVLTIDSPRRLGPPMCAIDLADQHAGSGCLTIVESEGQAVRAETFTPARHTGRSLSASGL